MAGRFLDYMAQGEEASLPAAASMAAKIAAGSGAIYYANDSGKFFFFDENAVDWAVLDISVLTGLYSDLDDVDWTIPATDGQIMIWDNTAGKWVPGDVPAGYDDTMADARIAAASIHDLSDVDGTGIGIGKALIWDGTNYVPTSIPAGYTDEEARDALGTALIGGTGITVTVDDGADTITIDSDITQYDDSMADARIAAASIGDLADVDITTTPPADGDTLVWDTDKFVPGAGGGGTIGIDGLSDVDTTTTAPVVGDRLKWNGTNWVPARRSGQYAQAKATASSSSAYASKGALIRPLIDFTIQKVTSYIAASGGTYKATVFACDSGGVVSSIISESAGIVCTGTGEFVFPLAAEAALTAGSYYGVVITLTSSTSTTSNGVYGANVDPAPAPLYTANIYLRFATLAPTVGQNYEEGANTFAIGFIYVID